MRSAFCPRMCLVMLAQRLTEQGFVTLTFDAAYQGESEGEPHGLENPFQRADDFRAAVSYLTTRDDVDPYRIGVLGICGSGGYAPYAAQTDHRMKAVATISAADVPSFFRDPDPEGFRKMVEQAGPLRSEEAAGKPARLVSALPDSVDDWTPPSIREFFDDYRTPRGHHPPATNKWVARSVDQLDQYDSYADVDEIAPRPLLMIAGTEAETLPFSQNEVEKAGQSAELFTIQCGCLDRGAVRCKKIRGFHGLGATATTTRPGRPFSKLSTSLVRTAPQQPPPPRGSIPGHFPTALAVRMTPNKSDRIRRVTGKLLHTPNSEPTQRDSMPHRLMCSVERPWPTRPAGLVALGRGRAAACVNPLRID